MTVPSEENAPSDGANTRRGLLLGVAAIATVGGLGVASWRQSGDVARREQSTDVGELSDFWRQQLTGVDGRTIGMSSLRGKPLLINFWATWCPPCVEELPMINQFYLDNGAKGWQVLGIAIDQKSKVEQFLKKMPLAFLVAVDGSAGTQLSRELGNLAGSLPFSVAFSAKSVPIYRKMGKLSEGDLAALSAAA